MNEEATRILVPDGRARPVAALRVGDVVLGTEIVEGVRRYVPTRVLAHRPTTRPAHAVRLAAGSELIVGAEHRFLTDAGWRHVSGGWRRPRLRAGSVLVGPGPLGPDLPCPHTPAYRAGYLCGLVRSDGLGFPSERLGLEALGRAHHLLAEARPVPVLIGAEPGRIARGPALPVADLAAWPQRPGDEWCAGFLAGVVDARGEVVRGELRVVHRDEDVVGRVAGALHRLGFRFAVEAAAPRARAVRLLGGPGALRRLLARTGPAVTRRLDGAPVVGAPELAVVGVRETGRATAMYEIATGTGDVVTEGVVASCARA